MRSKFSYIYIYLLFIILLNSCSESLFYSAQKSFIESPQYKAMRTDKSYPATILAIDQNNDGFSDAWVLMEKEEGRWSELWLQKPIKSQKEEAS